MEVFVWIAFFIGVGIGIEIGRDSSLAKNTRSK